MEKSFQFLRPQKAENLRNIYNAYENRSGSLTVKQQRNCIVSPLGQIPGKGVDPSADIVFSDCDYAAEIKPCSSASISTLQTINGKVLYGGYIASQWGLFLLNATERLWPLFSSEPLDVDYIVFFPDIEKSANLRGNFKEFFELLGILDKVIICKSDVYIENLLIPDSSFEHPDFYAKEFMSTFEALKRNASVPADANSGGKVFFTRSQMPHAEKRSINIKELDKLFAMNGYEIVAPEKLSIKELLAKVSGASSVASVSGTLAHNFLFCDTSSEFIIIERTAANNDYQVGVNLIKGINPVYVDGFLLPAPLASIDLLFLFAKTEQLDAFIRAKGWTDEGTFPNDERQKRRELRRFFKSRKAHFAYQNRFLDWELKESICIGEACVCAGEYYAPWLTGIKPLRFRDIFTDIYLRRLAKLLLFKCKLRKMR